MRNGMHGVVLREHLRSRSTSVSYFPKQYFIAQRLKDFQFESKIPPQTLVAGFLTILDDGFHVGPEEGSVTRQVALGMQSIQTKLHKQDSQVRKGRRPAQGGLHLLFCKPSLFLLPLQPFLLGNRFRDAGDELVLHPGSSRSSIPKFAVHMLVRSTKTTC